MAGKAFSQGSGHGSGHGKDDSPPIRFGDRLVSSEGFKAIFKEGMALVEGAAAYLDGPGREEAKGLPRMEALAYATESMRLTTRLMQLASWLLLQRAVNEGEMSQNQAANEKNKVRLARQEIASTPDVFARLPERLRELAIQSLRLQERIIHLDTLIYRVAPAEDGLPTPGAVAVQIERLRQAFSMRVE